MNGASPGLKEIVFRMVAEKKLTASQATSLVKALGENWSPARIPKAPPPVAVVGMSGRFPGAEDIVTFWDNLCHERCAVAEPPQGRWSARELENVAARGGFLSRIDEFDPLFFNISPREAELMDTQQRVFVEEAWSAIEDAGYSAAQLDGARCGVFVGVGSGDYSQKLAAEGVAADGYAFMGNANSILTARIAYLLNLKGPCLAIDTACSSSLIAIHLACESLQSGASDIALAGGVCILNTPNFLIAGGKAGMLSASGLCRAFDDAADGFVPAEAAGVIVLKPLARAVADGDHIYGVIEGSAVNQDGKTNGITAPSAPSQTALELEVYRLADIHPESIGYVEAHGTGTRLGDPIEVEALSNAFRKHTVKRQFCALGSVKSNIGHAMSAAGVVSVIKVLLALKHRQIPASLHFSRENTALELANTPFFVSTSLRSWDAPAVGGRRRAAISAFGFSGTNAHMVVAEAPETKAHTVSARPYLIVLSAKTPTALIARRQQLSQWLDRRPDLDDLAAIAYTLACGRTLFEHREAFTVRTVQELRDRLKHTSSEPVQNIGTIDWNVEFPESDRRRIPLPSYPFERKRYAPPDHTQPSFLRGLHPLLDRACASSDALAFRTTFSATHVFLRDHVVNGRSVLPGVCHLEMACAAARTARIGVGPITLEDVVFLRPLTVGDTALDVQIDLRESPAGYRFRTHPVSDPGQLYSEGSLSFSKPAAPAAQWDVPSLIERLRPSTGMAQLFATFEQAGVVCGPFCRGLRELWLGDCEALGELRLPEGEEASLAQYTLHPTLLDGSFQTAMAFWSQREPLQARSLLVPFSIGRIEVLEGLTSRCFAYVKWDSSGSETNGSRFQVALLAEDGRLLAKITDFSARAFAKPGIDLTFFKPSWREQAAVPASEDHSNGVLLIVRTPGDFREAGVLSERIGSHTVLYVSLGDETRSLAPAHFSIDWRDQQAFNSLVGSLKKLDCVYFLARQDPAVDILDPALAQKVAEETTFSLWRLARAVQHSGFYTAGAPLTIKVVTGGVFSVALGDVIAPLAAGLSGLARTISREYPHLLMVPIDVLQSGMDCAIREQGNGSGNAIAIRGDRRYVQTLEPVTLAPVSATPFRQGGVYVLIGGAGGLGLTFAAWLASQWNARVLLVGRSAADANLLKKIAALSPGKGEVHYEAADVTDLAQMRTTLDGARSRWGRINGLIHAAMVLRDRSLERMDEETFRAVLAPKVAGSVVLGCLLRDQPLDFVAFFSSANALFGNAGQGNYAAASTFQDAFGLALKQQFNLPVKVFNWGFWGDVGAVASAFYRERVEKFGVGSIGCAEGIEAFEKVLRSDLDQTMPMKISPATLAKMGLSLQSQDLGELFERVENYGRLALRDRLWKLDELRVVPKYARLWKALDAMFDRAGLTHISREELTGRVAEASAARDHTIAQHPWTAPFFHLLSTCIERYPEILRGDVPATQVLFPNSSLTLVEPLYRGNPVVDRYNAIVAKTVVAAVAERTKPIRILEVGAGTGGTSVGVLAALAPFADGIEYEYTDISQGFIQHAERTFKSRYPFLRARVLDISKDIRAQDFIPESFDIVFATNVIHATRDIRRASENLRLLLKPGGLLILNEAIRVQDFSTITFGLTDGWWLYEDPELRIPGSPLLAEQSWRDVLQKSGFEWAGAKGDQAGEASQMVFAARAHGPLTTEPATSMAEDPLEFARETIQRHMAQAMKLTPSDIDSRKRFSEYGVDSIVGVDLVRTIGDAFGINLRATILFDYASVSDLAAHLCAEHADKVAACANQQPPAPKLQKVEELFAPTPPALRALDPAMPIAVVGLAGRFPGARNTREFWNNLKDGICSITEVPADRWDVHAYYDPDPAKPGKSPCKWGGFVADIDCFDPMFFSMSGAEAEFTDPQQRLFLQEAWTALEDAGYSPTYLEGRNCGVFVGVGAGDYVHKMYEQGMEPNPYAFLGNGVSVLASRISYLLNLKGPALAIDTACSSSLVAVHLACQSLRNGDCELALAGGVFLSTTPGFHYLTGKLGMLSPSGECRAFDDRADGFVPGEAVGAVVLRPLADAIRDGDNIYGVIRGSGVNQDGHTNGITAPSALSQAALESEVYRKAGVDPATITMIEAHGTGTRLGDPIEVEALTQAFRTFTSSTGFAAIGSVKTNIGHAGPAAGIAGLIKTLLSLKHGQIPPSLHFEKPNRHIAFDSSPFYANMELRSWTASANVPRRAAVSAFGLSGTNAHLVVEEAPAVAVRAEEVGAQIIVLSAHTEAQLRARVQELLAWLETSEGISTPLADVAYTLATGRAHTLVRVSFIAESRTHLVEELQRLLSGAPATSSSTGPAAQYSEGTEIDWCAVFANRSLRRVSLPAYPFARDRYWLPEPSKVQAPTDLVYYEPIWQPSEWARDEVAPTSILVLGGDRALVDAIGSAKVHWLAELPQDTGVLANEIGRHSAILYRHHDDREFLFRLAASLALVEGKQRRQILILEDLRSNVAGAFSRPIRLLHPNIQWTTLQVADPVASSHIVWRCLCVNTGPSELRYDARSLFERRYSLMTPPREPGTLLRRGGVYWLAGGTGSIGTRLADYLADRYEAHVILTGRRSHPSRRHTVIQADITDRSEMRAAFDQIRARFGQLNGVFHLAGVIRPELIHQKTYSQICEVLGPKIDGCRVLDEVTERQPLDFFALFSSLSSITGDFGQCDYAVANRLLDNFAETRADMVVCGQRHGKTVSIGWPLWDEGGMHFDSETEQRYLAAAGLKSMSTHDAMAALEACLSGASARIYVAQGDRVRIDTIFNPPVPLASLPTPSQSASLAESIRQMVASLLKLPADRVSLDGNLSALGLDSLNMKALADTLGKRYGIAISPSAFFEAKTIAAVSEYIGRDQPAVVNTAPPVDVPESSPVPAPPQPSRVDEPVAIIGMSGRFPQSRDLDEFWKHLANGDDLITEIPADRWDWHAYSDLPHWGGFMPALDRFDAAFFGISPREAMFMDPQHRIFLETVWHTFEDAGYAPSHFAGGRVGVFVGCQFNEYMALAGDAGEAKAQAALGSTRTMLPNRVSYLLDLRGPSEAVDTACSSALVAVHRAVRAIQSGECSAAIAGGVSAILSPETYILASKLGMLSPEGRCKTFDRSANGYVKGEGVGAVLLKPLSQAVADGDNIHAVIRSTAENHGGRANFLTAPNPEAQFQLLVDAWDRASIDPKDLTYIEVHGTGTELGDPIEVDALRRAFAHYEAHGARCALGSVKTNIGHLEPAAGIAGLLKVVLCMRHRYLPATLHLKDVNPYLHLENSPFFPNTSGGDWQSSGSALRLAAVSSFGFGGSNAHAVVEEFTPASRSLSGDRLQFIPLSAKTEERLRVVAENLCTFLEGAPTVNWNDVAYTLQTGRESMQERMVIAASSATELVTALRAWLENDTPSDVLWRGSARGGSAGSLFDTAEELEEFIRSQIAKGKLAKVVRLWTEGLNVPWSLLHAGASGRRVSLPGYPFEQTRHWFDAPSRPAVPLTAPPIPAVVEDVSTQPAQIKEELRKMFAAALYMTPESIDDDASFADLGLDSILAVELVKQINDRFALDLNATRLYDYSNLKELSQYLAQCGPSISPVVEAVRVPAAEPPSSPSHLPRVKQILAEVLSLSEADIPDQTDLLELGLDMVSAADLSRRLKQEFGIAIPGARLLGCSGAQALAADIEVTKAPTATIPQPFEQMEIAIIGMSGRFPGADNLDEYWNNLRAGVDSVQEIPADRWDADKYPTPCRRGGFLKSIDLFDPLFFNISPNEAIMMDPQQRLFLEEAWKALEDAGYSDSAIANKKCALFVGVAPGDYASNGANAETLSPTGNANSILAARLAYYLDLKGPAVPLDTACSSALVAAHLACQGLARGEYEMAVAGGVSIFTSPTTHLLTSRMQMLSPEGRCKTFDDSADGFVPAEGAGVVVLKALARALEDRDQIYAVIRGSGINQDGRTNGILAPSALSQMELQLEVYRRYGIDPARIGCVEAHGTGTKLGDPIEIEALTNSFPSDTRQYCAIGSVKTNIGHALPAAGVAGLIKLVLSLRNGQIPPTLHCGRENEHIAFAATPFFVNRELRPWTTANGLPRLGAINSFGFSGTNAHMVVQQAPSLPPSAETRPAWLFTLSAKTSEARQAKVAALANFLRESGEPHSLADISFTLNACRSHFRWRAAVVAGSHAELLAKLENGCLLSTTAVTVRQPEEAAPALDLNLLAAKYIEGHDIDFRPLYPRPVGRKISLPAYPFARKRYWLPIKPDAHHPLIDTVTPSLTAPRALKRFSTRDEVVRQHRVKGTCLLPGAAVLEMARATAAAAEPSRPVTGIRNLIWRIPLSIGQSDVACELTLKVSTEAAVSFELTSESSGIHSQGELAFDTRSTPSPLDLEAVMQRCPHHLSGEEIYRRFQQLGIEHGPFFQHLQWTKSGDGEVIGQLKLSPAQQSALATTPLHPGIMDAALQTLMGFASPGNRETGPMLPFALDRFHLYSGFTPVCYVCARHVPNPGKDQARFDLRIVDERGNVLMDLDGFCARRSGDPDPVDEPALLTLRPAWKPNPLPQSSEPVSGSVLIFHPENDLGLSKSLSACHSGNVSRVLLGSRFERLPGGSFTIDHRSSVDFDRVFDEILPSRIYFLGAMEDTAAGMASLEPDAIDRAQETGVWALFHLVRTLALRPRQSKDPLVIVVTNGVNRILPTDRIFPNGASSIGLCKVAAKEYTSIPFLTVDLESGAAADRMANLLACETVAVAAEIAYRDNRRLEQTLVPIEIPEARPEDLPLRERGVYLILGGAGGLGLEFARYLATRVHARLVLIGRSTFGHAHEAAIRELEALGGQAVYQQADGTSLPQIERVVAETVEQWGAINGVIQSAFVLRDRTLGRMDDESFRVTFDSKVRASAVLAKSLAGQKLDWFVFFSSSISFSANAGQANYTAGSRFQDAFGLASTGVYEWPVKVINWGYWGDTGVVSTDNYRSRAAALGVASIRSTEGTHLFERLLASDVSQIVPVKLAPSVLQQTGLDLSRPFKMQTSQTIPGLVGQLPDSPAVLFTDFTDAAQVVEHYARQAVAGMAKVDHADVIPTYRKLWHAIGEIARRGPESTAALDLDEIKRRHPLAIPMLDLLCPCLAALPDVLQGRKQATAVLFPDNSSALVESLYRGNPLSDFYNDLAANSIRDLVRRALSNVHANRKVRILELGAGTGATSAPALEALLGFASQIEYWYTDVSPHFTDAGRSRFALSYPFVHFEILDLEAPLDPVKFPNGSFDFILAANVLHVPGDVQATLSRLKRLLKRSGVLVLNEAVAASDFLTLTFGLTKGWWNAVDIDARLPHAPLLSYSQWQHALHHAGFFSVRGLGQGAQQSSATIVAESDGWFQEECARLHACVPRAPVPVPPVTTRSVSSVTAYVSAIFTEVLRLDDGDFETSLTFDRYGVDSLVAMDIVARLERDLGPLPRTLLFEHPTADELAQHLAATYPAETSRFLSKKNDSAALVPIRTSGDAPASFWVHSLLGEISWVIRLAHRLGENFPVYAFQRGETDFTTMEQMAGAYVAALRTAQPHGPYVLGGYSLGGAIAFEMARQLHAAGESVSSLILIDSYAPGSRATKSFTELSWDGFMVLMLANTLGAQWKGTEPLRPEMLPPNDPEGQFQVAARHLRATTSVPHSHEELQALLRRSLESSLANATLFERYQARPFPGNLDTLLFRNTQGFVAQSNPLGIPAVRIDEAELDHGWSHWLPQQPRIVPIDSDHFSLGQEPAIAQVAHEIVEALTKPVKRAGREHIFAIVKEQVLRVMDGVSPHSITLETSLRELGANSIDRVEVAIFSMEQLNLDVPRSALSTVQDLRGLVDLFQAHTT